MSKICCIEDANICPKSSSCSMVLRSACSHKHSHSPESSIVKESLSASSLQKSKHTSVSKKDFYNGSLHLESLESSLKQLSLKSPDKTYSVLKGPYYHSLELSEGGHREITETSSFNVSCTKELHFSQLSVSNSSINNHLNHKECSSDYSSANESDMNSSESLNSTSNSNMSRRFTRSSLTRNFSDSEDDDISIHSIRRPLSISDVNNSYMGTTRKNGTTNVFNKTCDFSSNIGIVHDIDKTYARHTVRPDGDGLSHMSESDVQYSIIDRFRWFLWRCTYLKIIRIINFDVWFLSRAHKYRKHLAIFLFLLPLLLFLLWGIFPHDAEYESLSQNSKSIIILFYEFLSSIFSSVFVYFTQRKEQVMISDMDPNACTSDSCGSFGVIPNWPVKKVESASIKSDELHRVKEFSYQYAEEIKSLQPNEGEIRIMATKILKEEISTLKSFINMRMEEMESNKLEAEQNLQKEILKLQIEFQSLTGSMKGLEKDFMKKSEKQEEKVEIISLSNEYKNQIDHLNGKLKSIEAKMHMLEEHLKNCCGKQWTEKDFLLLLDNHLVHVFKNVADGDSESRYNFFNEWLNSKFFTHEKLMQVINVALQKQAAYTEKEMDHDKVIQIIENTVSKYVDSIKRNLSEFSRTSHSSFNTDMFSEDKIKKIIKEAIMLYDADKIGQVDYALESGGGSVLGTRCSETYVEKYGKLSIFGVPLWTNSNSPRTAIQPDVQPGRCWAFKGSQGFLVIELSATVYPTGFTLEHIPVSLSPSGSIDSAPKNFSVWGLDSEKDSKGNLLGEYWYDISGEPLQYFAVQKPSGKPYSFVELQIHSNHGNMEYTCLYRFRVHGKRTR